MMLLFALALWAASHEPMLAGHPCSYYEPGTDAYLECTTGEEIDLSPVIEDEAQTLTSQGRE